MSLGTWFRDYVYIPIGGNRCGRGRQLFNIFVVWALTGIWHGANWKYIGFGVWNGAIMFVSSLLEPAFRKFTSALKIRTECLSYRIFQMIRTFIVVLIGYYFDIADGFKDALFMMKNSVLDFHPGELMYLSKIQYHNQIF